MGDHFLRSAEERSRWRMLNSQLWDRGRLKTREDKTVRVIQFEASYTLVISSSLRGCSWRIRLFAACKHLSSYRRGSSSLRGCSTSRGRLFAASDSGAISWQCRDCFVHHLHCVSSLVQSTRTELSCSARRTPLRPQAEFLSTNRLA